jgi:hypothetical protein
VLRALRELVVVLAVIVALAFLAAYLYQHLGNVDAHQAYAVVFYVGGGVLLVFALVTRGAGGGRAYDLAGVGLRPPPCPRARAGPEFNRRARPSRGSCSSSSAASSTPS